MARIKAQACDLPLESLMSDWMQSADFADAYRMPLEHADLSALDIYLNTMRNTPAWVDRAMWLRNKVVGLVGIKNLGGLADVSQFPNAQACQIGQRVGLFKLLINTPLEAVLEDDDKHLTVKISVLKQVKDDGKVDVVISTAVHNKNWMGRVYMIFVKPMHKIIAPVVTAKIGA